MRVRHCALSLVGEPIMYPHINELLGLLHGRRISSFLVTNAQFPELIDSLCPVTQVSPDCLPPLPSRQLMAPTCSLLPLDSRIFVHSSSVHGG